MKWHAQLFAKIYIEGDKDSEKFQLKKLIK